MRRLAFLVLFLGASSFLHGAKLHEAYIPKETDSLFLQEVSKKPPQKKAEVVSENSDEKASWIPGYWAWDDEISDFEWVRGFYRTLPLEHTWVPGFWHPLGNKWVWNEGYFRGSEEIISPISKAPPPKINERIPQPENVDQFWVNGMWIWDTDQHKYTWHSGLFGKFNSDWVFVPCRYIYREKGYLLVSSYWDYPLEKRARNLNAMEARELTFTKWPDHKYFFLYDYKMHPDFYPRAITPPWWKNQSGWFYNSKDEWWLWWWWTHPGYPKPPFLMPKDEKAYYRPPARFIEHMKKIKPPCFVTKSGVTSEEDLLKQIKKLTKHAKPIMPSNALLYQEIQEKVSVP